MLSIGTLMVLIGSFMAFRCNSQATWLGDSEEDMAQRVQLMRQYEGWTTVIFGGFFLSFIGLFF